MTRPFKKELFSVAEFNRRFTSDNKFREFARQVYGYLDKMKVGHRLRLDRYDKIKQEWIVLTASAFIAEGVHSLDYYFSDDFSSIVHTYVEPEVIEKCREIKYGSFDLNSNNNEEKK